MTPTKLSIYNGALNACKARRISSLSVDEEARYVLDDNWDRDFINTVLEKGLWNFAMRTVQIDADPDYTDPLGSGWHRSVRTVPLPILTCLCRMRADTGIPH